MVAITKSKRSTRKTRVLLWGPFPHKRGVFGGGIGGYARCNSQMLKSSLAKQFAIIPLHMTVPRFQSRFLSAVYLWPRMLVDVLTTLWALVYYRPDVLHITALYWRSIFREAWATWIARKLGVAVFYDVRAGTFETFAKQGSRYTAPFLRYIMKRATAIGVEGKRYLGFVKDNFGRSATLIPNFFLDADLSRYVPAPLEKLRPGEPLRLAFVGYLIPDKGVDVLLEVGKQLSEEMPVEVTLIGAVSPQFADTLQRYRELQSETFAVIAPGRLELNDILFRLQKQHLFVFLSRFFGEGHTNAVNEAMAMGLPVVASRNGFLADVVTEECGVTLRDPTDVESVKSAIKHLYHNWDELQMKGRGARRKIETQFNSKVVLKETAGIYEQCRRGGRDR